MTLISKYIFNEIARLFVVILVAVVGIYLAVDFIEKVDNFMEAGAPVSRALVFLIYKVPFIIAQITPIGVLLAVLVTFGLMSKQNELLALRTSGISMHALLRPSLFFGLTAALTLVFISETIAPLATRRSNQIWLSEVKQRKIETTRDHDVWLKTDHAIVHFQYYHNETETAQGISYNRFDSAFRLIHRVDAGSGRFEGGKWVLHKVVEQSMPPDAPSTVSVHDSRAFDLEIAPDDLQVVARQSSEMNFGELYRYIRRVEAEGYDATVYRVDLHSKIAFPFACLVMGLIGVGVAARGRIRDGMVTGVIYGLAIIFVYWIFFSFSTSLGYGGLLPPWIAVWLANFVFACLGWMLLLYAH